MEIRKSLISSQNLASLMRQRGTVGVAAGIDRIAERSRPGSGGAGREREARIFDPEEVRSALQVLEEGQACAGPQARRDSAAINNRARQALDAYVAQQNLDRDDARLSLRQLLGVDCYA